MLAGMLAPGVSAFGASSVWFYGNRRPQQANVCGVNCETNRREDPAVQRQLPRPGPLLTRKVSARLGGGWFLTPRTYKTGRLNANNILLLKKTLQPTQNPTNTPGVMPGWTLPKQVFQPFVPLLW